MNIHLKVPYLASDLECVDGTVPKELEVDGRKKDEDKQSENYAFAITHVTRGCDDCSLRDTDLAGPVLHVVPEGVHSLRDCFARCRSEEHRSRCAGAVLQTERGRCELKAEVREVVSTEEAAGKVSRRVTCSGSCADRLGREECRRLEEKDKDGEDFTYLCREYAGKCC